MISTEASLLLKVAEDLKTSEAVVDKRKKKMIIIHDDWSEYI